MRAAGSIKSLTTGVATVDKSMHADRQYMKSCVNMRNDQTDGLRRRPPAEIIRSNLFYTNHVDVDKNLIDFDPSRDVFKAIMVDGDRYWYYNRTDQNQAQAVFDDTGLQVDFQVTGGNMYLRGCGGNDGVQLVTSGRTTYIINRNEPVRKIENSGPVYLAHSMLTLREAPRVFSTVIISWENPDYTQTSITYEIGEDHPVQPIPDIDDVDTGVQTVTGQIAAKIRQHLVSTGNDNEVEIDDDGSTIVFRNVSAGVGSELWKDTPTNLGGLVNPWVDEGAGVYFMDGNQVTTIKMYDDTTPAVAGQSCEVIFTITDYVGGSVRAVLGEGPGAGLGTFQSGNGTYTETIIVGGDTPSELGFQADSSFIGRISGMSIIPAKGGDARPFLKVSVQDGTGGAFLAINGSVKSLDELPRFAHPSALLTINPNQENDRGVFYMRAESVLEAEAPNPLPAPDWTLTSETRENTGNYVTGFVNIPGFGETGDMNSRFPLSAYPNHECIQNSLSLKLPENGQDKTTIFMNFWGPENDIIPAEAIQFVEIWDETGIQPIRVAQAFMYQTVATPSLGGPGSEVSNHLWEGTIDAPVKLTDGVTYNCYFRDVVGNFKAVPEVRWVEDSAPKQDTQLNPDTMPHILHRREDGSFEFGTFNTVSADAVRQLSRRTSGDDNTNPFPAFLDNTLKDIATFQNRLCILSEDKVMMSVTNRPEEWFRGTVTQLLATSPISIQSTAAAASKLENFVTHNNDLMVFGPKGQFRFSGNLALTPVNAALPQASSYECEITATPKSSGNDVFFPTTYGESSGVSQFSLDPQIENLSVAKPMADLQIGLLEGSIQQIEAAPNTGIVYIRMGDDQRRIYTMEFEPQIDILKPLEPTWSWWQFDWGVRIITMRAGPDYLEFAGLGQVGAADEGRLRLYRMELNGARKQFRLFEYQYGDVHLDCRNIKFNTTTTLTVPDSYPVHKGGIFDGVGDLVLVEGNGCPEPGKQIGYSGTYPNLVLDEDMGGGDVYFGYIYTSAITLPDIDVRDGSGIIMERAKLRISDWDITLTGWLDARVSLATGGAPYPIQEWRGIDLPGFVSTVGYNRGTFRVQYRAEGDVGQLILRSSEHVGMDVHQVEWRGAYNNKGRRF